VAAASAAELVTRIESALAAGGLQPARATIAGSDTVVGGTSEFKWRWIAATLNSFLYVAAFQPGSAALGVLDSYLAAARDDAINHEGAMWGFQPLVSAITVAVIDRATPQDEAWAARPHVRFLGNGILGVGPRRPFAAITFPVLADAAAGKVVRPDRMIVGAFYTGYLQDLVRQYVEAPLRG
jgi:hypothetical protein